MVTPATRFSCAAASSLRDEPLSGTATHVRTWVLLEHSGPWGNDALLDARLPDGLGAALKQQARTYRAKILLVRRARAKRDPEQLNIFVADAHPRRPRVEHGTVADLREVLDLDLTAFREGGSAGLAPYEGSLFCVCTNGRHDACCAEFGRPVAMALDDAHPEQTWEVSHIGGDRFAGNLVVLPEGLYYGRLDPQRAIGVAGAHLAGELDLDHLRGRSSYPMAVQAAELHLRRRVGATRVVDVALVRRAVDGDVTTATFAVAGATYVVRVRTLLDPETATRLTCKAHRDNPIPRHELLAVERTS
ncbi:sucrase ferredoxin [Nocardioides immobilis]|uniref:Sucrase ferredoxin n=1 Tax=Nocardioides immobilis TaxID=2049295 RepID=A0A417Y671_9ACTN|nr:sucrase ferredoxin [Nocardioides immobilis]RHW28190.1 sucrase ferredoxin [Nocardioides immobilis]